MKHCVRNQLSHFGFKFAVETIYIKTDSSHIYRQPQTRAGCHKPRVTAIKLDFSGLKLDKFYIKGI